MADLIPRSEQLATNMASLLTCCATLLACLSEHASREDGPLRPYTDHLHQLSENLTALVQTFVDDVPERGQP